MAKSKVKISKQTERKTNPELVKTIFAAKKHKAWFNVAEILSGPRRKKIDLNLENIDKGSKEGETIVVPGKVLSQGEITKKINVVAVSFSEKAKDKLLKSKCKVSSMLDEIKKNPDGKRVKVLK
ncbi:50S ribosomal protein L18e [Candidatus Pacearchaeota archaeon]|nr:50S ribosomal protein L18e [Candidatus Pacearchaeota archaeon]